MWDSPTDAIDFPCSATYAGAYAEQGLTPDFPREYYEDREDLNLELQAQLLLAQRGVIMVEPVSKPTKWGTAKNIEAQLMDLRRNVEGLIHSHSKENRSPYVNYDTD